MERLSLHAGAAPQNAEECRCDCFSLTVRKLGFGSAKQSAGKVFAPLQATAPLLPSKSINTQLTSNRQHERQRVTACNLRLCTAPIVATLCLSVFRDKGHMTDFAAIWHRRGGCNGKGRASPSPSPCRYHTGEGEGLGLSPFCFHVVLRATISRKSPSCTSVFSRFLFAAASLRHRYLDKLDRWLSITS